MNIAICHGKILTNYEFWISKLILHTLAAGKIAKQYRRIFLQLSLAGLLDTAVHVFPLHLLTFESLPDVCLTQKHIFHRGIFLPFNCNNTSPYLENALSLRHQYYCVNGFYSPFSNTAFFKPLRQFSDTDKNFSANQKHSFLRYSL